MKYDGYIVDQFSFRICGQGEINAGYVAANWYQFLHQFRILVPKFIENLQEKKQY